MRISTARSQAAHGPHPPSRTMHVHKLVVKRAEGDSSSPALPTGEGALPPAAVVRLSPAAQSAATELRLPGADAAGAQGGADASDADPTGAPDGQADAGDASTAGSSGAADAPAGADGAAGPGDLTEKQQQVIRELEQRDREVRAHEAAHQAAGGTLAGGARFTTQTGPDGRQYAIGGEVSIQMSGGRTPEQTIARAQQIRSAALAPADPSSQDQAVAAAAAQMEAQARQQLSQAQRQQAPPAGAAASTNPDSGEPSPEGGSRAAARTPASARRAIAAYRSA